MTPFDDDDEVAALANDSTFGLAAQVWTRDIGCEHRIAQRTEAGMIMLNRGIGWDPAMPFGAFKQSGWGYENGQEGLEGYLKTKTVLARI